MASPCNEREMLAKLRETVEDREAWRAEGWGGVAESTEDLALRDSTVHTS